MSARTVIAKSSNARWRWLTVLRIRPNTAPVKAFGRSDHFPDQSNAENYQSACPWDIYSLRIADEMVG